MKGGYSIVILTTSKKREFKDLCIPKISLDTERNGVYFRSLLFFIFLQTLVGDIFRSPRSLGLSH